MLIVGRHLLVDVEGDRFRLGRGVQIDAGRWRIVTAGVMIKSH